MKPCVLFNPLARGEKAATFRKRLESLRTELDIRETISPDCARRLAKEAVEQGCDTVAAAGGDGTFNEVLNGVGLVPKAFGRVRLGLLPLGTANVFAKELRIPLELEKALEVLRRGKERLVDLAMAFFEKEGQGVCRYFGQLGGAGLDARAIDLVNWKWKKHFGTLAYVAAGLKAIAETPVKLTLSNGMETASGELALISNGRYYGGKFEVFPNAGLSDGLLRAAVFERVHWADLARRGWGLFTRTMLRQEGIRVLQGTKLELKSDQSARFHLEGDLAGQLPCVFKVSPRSLRMIVP